MRLSGITVVLCACVLLFSGCAHFKPADNTSIKTANLRVTTDIPGWAEVASTYQAFSTVDQLAGEVGLDGEAYLYSNKGLRDGIYQKLSSRAGYRLELYILDFGAEAGAAAVFDKIASSQISGGIPVGGLARADALAQDNGNSMISYAHFGCFFCKLSMTDYGGAISNATGAVGLFLDFYKRRIAH